jgi:hypothetical protein
MKHLVVISIGLLATLMIEGCAGRNERMAEMLENDPAVMTCFANQGIPLAPLSNCIRNSVGDAAKLCFPSDAKQATPIMNCLAIARASAAQSTSFVMPRTTQTHCYQSGTTFNCESY